MTETSFVPGPDTQRDLRDALGCFGTGVTVVTTMTDKGPLAMTANSFASVSLDPPLVLWCPATRSARHPHFADAEHYVIQVMGDDQLATAQAFARDGWDFDHTDWSLTETGQPVLSRCLARFECRRTKVHEAGDHSIILGEVRRAAYRPGKGLIFKRGQYGGFADFP
jgi:flavin reductase (DIM6/NTAB) family NADH-FMN oxidoreductase RutF